jgi:hypothetical protein
MQGMSIVAVGSFNPAIFQPRWFSWNNLIPEGEAGDAKIEIIHRDVSIFSTDWFSLQATGDRFLLDTRDPTKCFPLRDLALGTFKILEHTPVSAFGFNSLQHFRMPSEVEWHAFGDFFAPKGAWRDIVSNPGMRAMIIQGKREGSEANQIQIRIEPSTKIRPGVLIRVNEHYETPDDKDANPKDHMVFFLKTLQGSWESFMSYCGDVARHLLAAYSRKGD